ncbi:MAG: hypothetical protein M3Y89_03575 [Actinomycetota bacterium]|nr:hypothetical protein [Actinomycetota bacterium]
MPAPSLRHRSSLSRISKVIAVTAALGATVLVPSVAHASSSRPATAPATTSNQQVAGYGAGWLASQITANGGYLTGFGVPDATDTAYAVIGLHAVGVGRQASAQAIGYLKTELGDALQGSDGTDSPGALAYYIMAAVSAGQDPYHFGGRAAQNDLVTRLLATERTTGTDTGLFGAADPSFDGAFRQGLALAALASVHYSAGRPAITAATAWLRGQQCSNGLWQSYRASVSVPCAPADPATFAGPDTNSTSLATQGLAAYGQHPQRAQLLTSLKAVQAADGGFGYLAAAGQSSDPDSTALSIQTILAENASPKSAYWRTATGSPNAALASFQLGCSAPVANRGAFFYPGSADPNVLATVQAVPAAAGKTLPVNRSTLSSAVPVPSCSASTNTLSHKAISQPLADRQALTLAAKSPLIGTAGACSGTTGVTVTVDFTAFGGVQQTRCAAGAQTSGVTALQNAGFTPAGTTHYGLAFICRINSLPSTTQQACVNTPPATAYWAYYHALTGATTWTYSTTGASSYTPPLGSIDAWAFGNSATPSKTPAQVRAGT